MFALAAAKRRLSLAVHLLLLVVIAATLVTPAAGAVPPRERGAEGAATSTDTNPPTKTTTTRTKTATVWATETQTGTRTNHTPPHTPGSTATTARSRTAASTPSASAVFSYPLSGDSCAYQTVQTVEWRQRGGPPRPRPSGLARLSAACGPRRRRLNGLLGPDRDTCLHDHPSPNTEIPQRHSTEIPL